MCDWLSSTNDSAALPTIVFVTHNWVFFSSWVCQPTIALKAAAQTR